MHVEALEFCIRHLIDVKMEGANVLEVGSLNINGSIRERIENKVASYTGVDLAEGPGVDIVCKASEIRSFAEEFDIVISTECFEHDMYFYESWAKILEVLKPGGIFIFTCAGPGRKEHGTKHSVCNDSPATASGKYGELWSEYYKNIELKDIGNYLDPHRNFTNFIIDVKGNDIRFKGVKR